MAQNKNGQCFTGKRGDLLEWIERESKGVNPRVNHRVDSTLYSRIE